MNEMNKIITPKKKQQLTSFNELRTDKNSFAYQTQCQGVGTILLK